MQSENSPQFRSQMRLADAEADAVLESPVDAASRHAHLNSKWRYSKMLILTCTNPEGQHVSFFGVDGMKPAAVFFHVDVLSRNFKK